MLVKEIKKSMMGEYPFHARRFYEKTSAWGTLESISDVRQQIQRIWNMFDKVAGYNDISGNM